MAGLHTVGAAVAELPRKSLRLRQCLPSVNLLHKDSGLKSRHTAVMEVAAGMAAFVRYRIQEYLRGLPTAAVVAAVADIVEEEETCTRPGLVGHHIVVVVGDIGRDGHTDFDSDLVGTRTDPARSEGADKFREQEIRTEIEHWRSPGQIRKKVVRSRDGRNCSYSDCMGRTW